MTKKHFEAMAALIKAQLGELEHESIPDFYPDGASYDTLKSTAIRMAAYFSSENPRFDPKKFLTACGF